MIVPGKQKGAGEGRIGWGLKWLHNCTWALKGFPLDIKVLEVTWVIFNILTFFSPHNEQMKNAQNLSKTLGHMYGHKSQSC